MIYVVGESHIDFDLALKRSFAKCTRALSKNFQIWDNKLFLKVLEKGLIGVESALLKQLRVPEKQKKPNYESSSFSEKNV